ncbi:hypothetical protein JCM8097_003377 [Rhodosporidiobolus ruineniae]
MSGRSPSAILPSSLSFAQLARQLPQVTNKQSARRTLTPSGFVVVRQQRRTASTTASASARQSGAPASGSGSGGAQVGQPSPPAHARTAQRPQPKSARVYRSTSSSALARSRSLGTYFDSSPAASAARQFHSSTRQPHQQPGVSPSSGVELPPAPSGSSGPSPSSSPKHHSSLATPSTQQGGTDAGILLSSNPYQGSSSSGGSGGGDVPSHIDHPTSSLPSLSHASQSPSTSSSSSHPSSSNPPASLFTVPPSRSVPPHALPSFFGSALSIARRSNLVFRNGAYGIPKPARAQRISSERNPADRKGKGKMGPEDEEHFLSVGVGEDAYFLRSDSLGVADGVGGWSGHAGANSARWARKFMHHCSHELGRYENVEDELFLQYYDVDPVDVMQRAFEKTLHECKEEGTIGSSTALLAVLRNDELRLANLGDCACCVIREGDYLFRTEEQQHQFNFPFQAGTNAKDTPAKDAQRFTVKVKRDDIVILASDGLVDNVFSDDLLEEVLRFVGTHQPLPSPPSSSSSSASSTSSSNGSSRFTLRRFSPQAVSEALCFRAKSVYDDQRAVASPFQQRAMEEGIHYAGGKIDDVSCLVGVVGELEAAPNRRDVA